MVFEVAEPVEMLTLVPLAREALIWLAKIVVVAPATKVAE
jgi:hypothetical protein